MQRILSTCLLLLCWTTTWAGNIIKVSSTQGHPGDEVTVSVSLEGDEMPTAVEMQLSLEDALKYVDGSAVLNAERSNGHSISAAVKNGNLSVVIFSPTLAALQGATGELFNFKLKLGKEPADYTLAPVMLLGDAKGNSLTHSVESGVVTLLSPKLEIVTPTIDFGHIPIRSTYTKSVGVRNVGNEPLLISAVTTDRTDLVAPQQDYTIAPGNTAQVQLNYLPIIRGAITAKVNFATNAINPKAGTANVVADPFSVNELRVQRVEGISDEEVTVVLKMNNMEPIAGAQCTFTLPEGLEYVAGSAAVGTRCDETDHVASGFVQGQKVTLLLYSSNNMTLPEGDGELLTFKVRLNGPSGYYMLTPEDVTLSNVTVENMVSATYGEYVVIQSPRLNGASALDMGSGAVTEKQIASYTISNNGAVDLVISRVTFLAEGYAVEEELPMIIEPGKSKTFTVSYSPHEEGLYKTTMQIYTNDPTNRMHSVELTNNIYEPNAITVTGENTKEGYRFDFGLDNYTDIVAVQMNISWKPGMQTNLGQLVTTDRLSNHSVLLSEVEPGIYQVLVYSLNNTPIIRNNGSLFTLDYSAAGDVNCRDTELKVTNIVLSDTSGKNYTSENEVSAIAKFVNFSLRFMIDDEIVDEQWVRAGSEFTIPSVEEREGHSFNWIDLPETMPEHDTDVVGHYTINSYQLTYMVDGEIYTTASLEYGTRISPVEAPVKEGYEFVGWDVLPSTMPAKDVVVHGVYKEIVTEVIIKVNQYGSGTYCSDYALDFSAVEGLKAYAATGFNKKTQYITLTRVMTAEAEVGLFIKGLPGEYVVPVIEESYDRSLNMLVATPQKTVVNSTSQDGKYCNFKYTIKSGESEPMFYQFTDGSTLSAGKAYLQIPSEWLQSAVQKTIKIQFDEGESTDIDNSVIDDSVKKIYDVSGRTVVNPTSGIYIMNGKKVYIK